MTPLERESLRVFVDAERTVAELVDPDDTMTVAEAIRGHDELLHATYRRLLADDAVIGWMRAL